MTFVVNGLAVLVGFISTEIWGRFSGSFHLAVSRFYSAIYKTRISRLFIRPYCWWQYGNAKYYQQFKPGGGLAKYRTFQDFFTREFKEAVKVEGAYAWPCEGLLCDKTPLCGAVPVKVKGERRHIRTIFGEAANEIPDDYFFYNVFLHNNNYHHIHAPVSGRVKRIERIPGDLLLLRPWAYKDYPSLPALRNERVNIDLEDEQGRLWYISIIGGPAVATIYLVDKNRLGGTFQVGEKIGGFHMGSTCCMACPVETDVPLGDNVLVGQSF